MKIKKILGKMFEKKKSGEEISREKKRFLSNDFIDRMIRTEQAVSSTFGEKVPYNKTLSYRELSEKEKKGFESYIKRKKNIKGVFTAFSLMMILSLIFVNVQFTGRVVENAGFEREGINIALIAAVFIGIGIFVLIMTAEKNEKRKFRKRLDVLDNLVIGRYKFRK